MSGFLATRPGVGRGVPGPRATQIQKGKEAPVLDFRMIDVGIGQQTARDHRDSEPTELLDSGASPADLLAAPLCRSGQVQNQKQAPTGDWGLFRDWLSTQESQCVTGPSLYQSGPEVIHSLTWLPLCDLQAPVLLKVFSRRPYI
jgi:hypothetical protein